MSDAIYDHPDVLALVRLALHEDLRFAGDLTAASLVPRDAVLTGEVLAKEGGTVCGLEMFRLVYAALGDGGSGRLVAVEDLAADGTVVKSGTVVGRVRGDAATVLAGERTALNLCQRLSGVATAARRYAEAVAGTRAQVYDTRKTTPGLRLLEKRAVVAGGCANHRLGLHDAVLIKNNHIALMAGAADACSPAAEAVRRCRARLGPATTIEVEIDELEDLEAVIAAGADLVLLDNMGPDRIRAAVAIRDRVRPGVGLEASGGITLDNVRSFALAGADRISTGALTHSVRALDLALHCRRA
jgi:nicotinate-nucleotide pyrophosphorylase (carboxylating)